MPAIAALEKLDNQIRGKNNRDRKRRDDDAFVRLRHKNLYSASLVTRWGGAAESSRSRNAMNFAR